MSKGPRFDRSNDVDELDELRRLTKAWAKETRMPISVRVMLVLAFVIAVLTMGVMGAALMKVIAWIWGL